MKAYSGTGVGERGLSQKNASRCSSLDLKFIYGILQAIRHAVFKLTLDIVKFNLIVLFFMRWDERNLILAIFEPGVFLQF